MSTVHVVDDAGRRVARKEVGSIDRARDEAALLQSLAHPGIVEVLRLDEPAAGHGVLVLAAVDGACLGELVLAPRVLTAVLAATATTVADLHDRGVCHGALRGDHVLVDAGHTPRLCGFGTAATSPHEHQDESQRATDVYDLALLARASVARWRSSEPSPARDDERAASALDALARRVVVSTPGRRPSARDLAAELARLATPGPLLAVPRRRRTRGRDAAASRLALGLAGVCLAISVVVAGVSVQRIVTRRRSVPAAPATSTVAATRETRATGRTSPTTATRATARATLDADPAADDRCGAPVVAVRVDPDGDGCGVVATLDGRRIRTAAGVFEVGSPGDAVALGDWDCDGFATPAVLQPDTGRVFVFDRWPTDVEVAGSASASVAGGRTMRSLRSPGRRCDRAVVDRDAGPSQVLDLAPAP